MGLSCQVWHCERQYRPVARGAGHRNCCVRGRNGGGAARLYSQPGVVITAGLAALLMITPSAAMVMFALPKVTPVVLAALTAFPPAGRFTMTPDWSVGLMGPLVPPVS